MQFLRIQNVVNKVTIKKSEIYERIKKNIFPDVIPLSPRISVWDHEEIELWMIFKKEMSINNTKFETDEEEARAWLKYRNDFVKKQNFNQENSDLKESK